MEPERRHAGRRARLPDRPSSRRRLGDTPRRRSLRSLNKGVSAEGRRFVAFVRLVPLFPFNLLNYALGLTRIPLASYVLASGVFMLPGALACTWLGRAGREALVGGDGMVRSTLIALAPVAALAFLPRLIRRLRTAPI